MTPASIILEVARIGGQIGQVDGKLRVALPDAHPPNLKAEIKASRVALLELIASCEFSVVKAEGFGLMFWAACPQDRDALIRHGADPGDIYDRAELEMLIGRGYTFQEIQGTHAAKKLFSGTIIGHPEQQ